MSYTLRGRLESRLAALVPVVAAACVLAPLLHRWWPVEAVALMAGVALALDLQLYDRVLAYQPGWLALPLGVLELAALLGLMRAFGIAAPLWQEITAGAAPQTTDNFYFYSDGCCHIHYFKTFADDVAAQPNLDKIKPPSCS